MLDDYNQKPHDLNALMNEARAINAEIDERSRQTAAQLDEIEASVGDSSHEAEDIFVTLDRTEEEAGEEFEMLSLEEARDLAQEEE